MTIRKRQLRERPAKRQPKSAEDEFSRDRQLEIRGGKIYLHEPLANKVQSIMLLTGETLREIVSRGLELVRKEVESEPAAEGVKTAKVQKPKAQGAKRARQKSQSGLIPDVSGSWMARHQPAATKLADRHGWLAVRRKGKIAAYLVSPRIWQTTAIDSPDITAVTLRGKVRFYLVPEMIWGLFSCFLAGFIAMGRRKLSALAEASIRHKEAVKREMPAILPADQDKAVPA